jgi:hypothetical protein
MGKNSRKRKRGPDTRNKQMSQRSGDGNGWGKNGENVEKRGPIEGVQFLMGESGDGWDGKGDGSITCSFTS